MENKTAKALGFAKGDFVHTGAFPAVLVSDAHTETPCCEVWGWEHEAGSCYAYDLKHLTFEEFVEQAKANGHTELAPFTNVARKAIKVALALAPSLPEHKCGVQCQSNAG